MYSAGKFLLCVHFPSIILEIDYSFFMQTGKGENFIIDLIINEVQVKLKHLFL